jgi:hypothetical protein
MINAYWKELEFQVQEGMAQDWKRVVDTSQASPNDFSKAGERLQVPNYVVAPRSVVVLLRQSGQPNPLG